MGPEVKGSPALTGSPSETIRFEAAGIKYSRVSSFTQVIVIFCLVTFNFPDTPAYEDSDCTILLGFDLVSLGVID